MARTSLITRADRSHRLSDLAVVVAMGFGLASLYRASRALVELVGILECSGAMGGTRSGVV